MASTLDAREIEAAFRDSGFEVDRTELKNCRGAVVATIAVRNVRSAWSYDNVVGLADRLSTTGTNFEFDFGFRGSAVTPADTPEFVIRVTWKSNFIAGEGSSHG